jgi:hypothetical protein
MSALRKEKPPASAETATQRPSARPGQNEPVDSAARRPPQSVTAPATVDTGDAIVDDTYDGEIVSSTVNPAVQPGNQRTSAAQSTRRPEGQHILNEATLRDFRARWDQIQTSFVDDPRRAVEQADALLGALVKHIADQLAEERGKIPAEGQDGSTEELRQNFQRYRALFDRLITF